MMRDPLAVLRDAAEHNLRNASDRHDRSAWSDVLYLLDQHEAGGPMHDPTVPSASNTDRELFREGGGDGNGMSHYEPNVYVTADEKIGMNVGGKVFVMSIREWHALAQTRYENLPLTGVDGHNANGCSPACGCTDPGPAPTPIKPPPGPPGPPRHLHADGTTCMWVTRGGIDRWRAIDNTGHDIGACPLSAGGTVA